MRFDFGGSDWAGIGLFGGCGRGRHLYVNRKGQILASSESPSIHLCHVEVYPNSMIGPIKLHRREEDTYIDEIGVKAVVSPYHGIIANASEYDIGFYTPQLSELVWNLGDEPAELICGKAVLITMERGDMVYRGLPGGFSKHEFGNRSHVLLNLGNENTTLFVASPENYDGFDVDQKLVKKFRMFARYVQAELSKKAAMV